MLEDPDGELLSGFVGMPMDVGNFLRLAVGAAAALGKIHQRGLIHKDIKPTNILVNDIGGEEIRLTGFGIASRLARERQPPDPPEVIAGTLAYMAPEQTGRMNRSVDSRSDLYSLGVTFYEMLTGSLPFSASDPMEWVHCHIARQADAPGERASGIPEVLSSIVMKLLAKTAEERYQTSVGVEADLRRCQSEWQSQGRIDPFPLGAHDASDRLLIAEQLYGREGEIATLLATFDRVVAQGAPELVLVSGYSGVGKSSVVNELHKVLVPPRGLFAAGKFDQYKRDVPYATLAQAFQTSSVRSSSRAKWKWTSGSTQDALKQFACLGNAAETFILILVQGEGMHTAFGEAVRAGLVVQQERAYKFLHDRIQQAAYSLISDAHRADVHLRIGRVLLASMTADQLAEHLFDVANHLNQGAVRLIDRDEKAQVATIDLRAGRKAKASAAYASALAYFSAGMALLDESDWSSQYELTFSVRLERAECEYREAGVIWCLAVHPSHF